MPLDLRIWFRIIATLFLIHVIFYLCYNSECLNQDEYTIIGICRSNADSRYYNYIECPDITGSRIKSKLTVILHDFDRTYVNASCCLTEWSLERHWESPRTDRPFYTFQRALIALCQSKESMMIPHSKSIHNSVC